MDVVSVKGDVEGAERDVLLGELLDLPPEALREGDAAGVNPDEGRALEARVALDDLVGDTNDRAPESVSVEQDPFRLGGRSHQPLLSGLAGPS
jgi:hypothetical protein